MFSTFSDYTYYILKHFIMNYDDSSETSQVFPIPHVDRDARILSTRVPFYGFRLANGQSLLSNKEGITVAFEN